MNVYCPVCHKRYGQTKLQQNEKVGLKCECGTWLEVEKHKITYVPLDKVSPKSVSCDNIQKQIEAKLDLDIIKQRLDEGEKVILDYMAEGYSADDIGHIMGISRQLVNYRFKKIQKKVQDFQKW